MCGRTACTLAPDDIVRACTYKDRSGKRRQPQWKDAPGGQQYKTSCNMAPSAHSPVLLSGQQLKEGESCDRIVMPMKWGLTPSWHKDDPYKVPYETNNCRVEGMLEKKTYKVPLQKGHRCVVLVDGFFEWKSGKDGKQPYFFHFPQRSGVSFSKKLKYDSSLVCNINETKTKVENSDPDQCIKAEVNCDERNKTVHNENEVKKETKESLCDMKNNSESSNTELECEDTKNCDFDKKETKASFWDVMAKEEGGEHSHGKQCDLENVSEARKRKFEDEQVAEEEEWGGQRLLTVAGVYDIWKSQSSSDPLYSYSVITVPASPSFSWCHHRMPAVLSSEEEISDWLDSARVPLNKAADLIRPTEGLLSYYPVTRNMNNSRYQNADCIEPIDISKPKANPSSSLMMNWLKAATPSKKT